MEAISRLRWRLNIRTTSEGDAAQHVRAHDMEDPKSSASTKRRSRASRLASLPLSLPPRGLSREESATYIGVSPTKFDQLVEDRLMPQPKIIGGRRVWDRLALDAAFSALPDADGNADHPEDIWSRAAL